MTKKVTWVVDEYILDRCDWQMHNLKECMKTLDCELVLASFKPFSKQNDPIDIKPPYVFYGTHGYMINARKEGYGDGIFCEEETLSVTNMLKIYPKEWILNCDSVKVNFKDFLDGDIDSYFDKWNIDSIHLRPDLCDKSFTGFVLHRDYDMETDLNFIIDDYDFDIMISPAQNIDCEMRFIVVDSTVVAGSCYRFGNVLDVRRDYYSDAKILAMNAAARTVKDPPDKAYTIDVAKVGDEFKIIELNSFSCAGFYAADIRSIVSAMNRMVCKTL